MFPACTRTKLTLTLLLAALSLAASSAAQAKRLALAIGNDSYRYADRLNNARADAKAVAAALSSTQFSVTLKQDLTLQQMKEALRAFKAQIAGGDEVVFYYSGHGVQLDGNNYLIPIDTEAQSADQIKDDSLSLQRVLDDLQDQKATFALAIIDACRDNPFKGNGRAIRTRGLAPVTAASGQIVLYSAGAGQEALDRLGDSDRDPNGVFTRVLVKEMVKPGLTAYDVLKNTRSQVIALAKSVNHEQVPALYDQSTGDFFFVPGTPGAQGPPAASAGAPTASPVPRAGPAPAPASASAPAPAPSAAVVPEVRGLWTMQVGAATWFWSISADGTYKFWSTGPGAVPGHAGSITMANGRWATHSVNWTDGGSYEMPSPDLLIATGNLGPGHWLRHH
jgi:hypothetical protein